MDADHYAVEAAHGAVGKGFPWVAGTTLPGSRVRFPDDLTGAPALLLVAYRRGAYSDVDRWTAFVRRETPGLKVLEVPAIPALVWRPLKGMTDGGRRGGVPKPQWSSVVTVCDDGAAVCDFVGDRGAPVAMPLCSTPAASSARSKSAASATKPAAASWRRSSRREAALSPA